MEHRPHPHYVRRVAGFSFGLAGGSIGIIFVGLVLKRFGLYDLGTLLEIAGAGAAAYLVVAWLRAGETTPCPACGRTLQAVPMPNEARRATFPCEDCDVAWETGDRREP